MKKILLLATLVLGMVSCMKDQSLDANLAGDGNFVLSVALPDEATRAAGEDSALGAIDNLLDLEKVYDIRYILEVFDATADKTLAKRIVKFEDTATETTFELRLIPGRHYSFVVWADFVERDAEGNVTMQHYDVSKLREIKVIGAQNAMDESRDAYTAVFNTADKGEKFSSASTISMELRRPFAKLRVVTNDMQEIYSTLQSAKVVYTSQIYKKYDALTTEPSNAERVEKEYNFDATTAYKNEAADDCPTKTLFADYLLGTETGTVQFTLDVADDVAALPQVAFNTNIPVQRNHLTTIYGPVLTDANNISVEIKDAFEGSHSETNTDSFASSLKDAENSVEATIELTEDVEWETGAGIGSTPWIPEGAKTQKLTVNANGHKITATGDGVGAIRMANGGLLIINDAVIVDKSVSYAENSWEYGYLEFGGKLEFNNCEFFNAVMMSGDEATFNNCEFNSHKDNEYAVWVDNGSAYFNACAFEGPRAIKVHEAYGSEVAEVVVDGCTFTNISKKPGMAIGDVNADTTIAIKNSQFIGCQAGDQGLYIYETDTDVTTFDFTESNNSVAAVAEDTEKLAESIEGGFTSINLAAGEYNIPSTLNNSHDSLTIVGAGIDNTTVNGTASSNNNAPGNYAHGLDLVFENLTFVTPNNGYNGGFGHAKSVTFRNCKIVGQYYAHSGAPHYFYDCTIDPLTGYLYTYASDCLFEGCTFSASEGKALQIYEDAATGENTVTITNCTFVAAKQATTWDGKHVTGIDINSNGAKFEVYINNCTTTGFPTGLNSNSDLWNVKDAGKAHVNVYVDGTQVWFAGYDVVANGLFKKENAYVVANAEGLVALNNLLANKTAGKGVKVALAADIDFAGKTWKTVDSHVDSACYFSELNGNGYTISNLTINGQAMFSRFAGADNVTIKNVTFDNAKVNSNGNINTSILTIQTYQNVLLDNVDVKNSTIIGGYKVAPLIATVYNESSSTITATLKNCDVENTVVKATSYDFCTAGMVAFVYEGDNDRIVFENCSVKGVKLYAPNVYTAHAAIYTAGSETLYNEAEGVVVENVTFENI